MLCGYVPVTKFIRIGIADKNDNPPYFDKALYEAEVDENEDIQHTVLTVTAKDHDECKYLHMRIGLRWPGLDVQGSFQNWLGLAKFFFLMVMTIKTQ